MAPPYERPDFRTPLERYRYLFDLKHFQAVSLITEDVEFMARYEASDEYKIAGRQFGQLLELAKIEAEMAQND